MNPDQFLFSVYTHYGLNGIIIVYLLWNWYKDRQEDKTLRTEKEKQDKEVAEKKLNGQWVSWQKITELDARIKLVEQDILNQKINLTGSMDHLMSEFRSYIVTAREDMNRLGAGITRVEGRIDKILEKGDV